MEDLYYSDYIELDRILGDERNYAGTSFVTPDMFGTYRYGSELLDVSFDPSHDEQYASYAFDDEGAAATKTLLIERGILKRPLGGALSQQRARLPGVANSRACSWNRPPIDRMANLNVEPGDATLDAMIAGIERGKLRSQLREQPSKTAVNPTIASRHLDPLAQIEPVELRFGPHLASHLTEVPVCRSNIQPSHRLADRPHDRSARTVRLPEHEIMPFGALFSEAVVIVAIVEGHPF